MSTPAHAHFDEQVQTLVERGYAAAAGMAQAEFQRCFDGLRERIADGEAWPFVLVVKPELVRAADMVERVERRGRPASSMLDADELARFVPTDAVTLPEGPAYLLVDVDTGAGNRGVTPDAALPEILGAGRSPLTIEEGLAVATHDPDAVTPNGGFSLLASRCGDRRVGALWISKGAPKLGWCWAGNPHTWLGSASCAGRVGA